VLYIFEINLKCKFDILVLTQLLSDLIKTNSRLRGTREIQKLGGSIWKLTMCVQGSTVLK
jgi:hypothetical protein